MDLYNRLELGDIRNVSEKEQEKYFYVPIYQILPLKYAKLILTNKELRFNNVFKYWDDPYELFLFKQNILIEGTPLTIKDFDKRHYGQCWSLNKDTDAMWRIYSPQKDGVRLKTTIGKMIEVLNQTRGMYEACPAFGLVKYVDKEFIINYLRGIEKGGSGRFFEKMSDSLFYKRKEFSHEKEVRFIIKTGDIVYNKCQFVEGDFINLKVDSNHFIEEIALDPRLDSDEVERIKNELYAINDSIPVCQSDLYAFEILQMNLRNTPMRIVNALDKYNKRNNKCK